MKIEIPIGENKIVAELYKTDGINYPSKISVYVAGTDGQIIQDLFLARPLVTSERSDDKPCETSDNQIECLVYGDAESEDYTEQLVIPVYDGESMSH